MFIPLPSTKQTWVYDDPSGVGEPAPYRRAWQSRIPSRRPRVTIVRTADKHVRFAHREA
ncbi:MAG: hypothetical protein ABUS54_01935 [Actinomycetota bacterium]